MKFRSLVFIFCGLLLGYYYFSGTEKSDEKSEVKNADSNHDLKINEDEVLKSEPVIKQTKNKAISKPTPKNISTTSEDKPNIKDSSKNKKPEFNYKTQIRFEVIDNYAVAAEDVLLGQPKDKAISGGVASFNDDVKLWPNGDVPFAFDMNLSQDSKEKALRAIEEFSRKTSIRFIPFEDSDKDFIVFSPSDNLCASYVGRIGGGQPVFLKPQCGETEIMHELMHALGFIHEHQREIRDQYIQVQYNNIQQDKVINFDIFPSSFQKLYRSSNEIDMKSLMIYSSKAFVTNPSLDSMTLKNSPNKIQDNAALSAGDIEKIDNVYFRKF